ncbi:phosphomethylpyrimidine kinase [Paucilactobacillus vaccinostercus DSM 20634]|uniref:Hydroxymethylpyrimidine/phosphomethylpyrimidine kinase n=1 Tax=Paucilactobacillus vaccinostercus DSM 20634 TaxID=1423813 RepID=A0A0R1ZZT3_9LACO|nr:bifunctional hydroxymethylpyrimidine kinase/phosphomethylpyrimidine kinase [Paucilactobacillus vaccinostercus]KRM60353.1 phosphomethylpyrimidine kinase [Paucilactobacillus vaccinostercus DSM 20634]
MEQQFTQALSIAGSDSGGGAGMQADLKTIQERHVFATTVLVAVTAQNTLGVDDFVALDPKIIDEQFAALANDLQIKACKTGMLADVTRVKTVVKNLKQYDFGPLTVDPVMIAKGGAPLLSEDAVAVVRNELLPLATVATPNLPEAEKLADMTIHNEEDMIVVAKKLQEIGVKNVMVKGGHFVSDDQSSDFVLLEDGQSFWLSASRVDTVRTHGTGDTLSACITAELAKGQTVEAAIRTGKQFVDATIRDGIIVGHGHGPLNHWAYRKVATDEV